MLHAAPKFVTLCLIVLITSLANAQIQNQNPASAPTDFYVGKWVLTFIGTPQGDGVSRLVLERKNGNLTGEMVDPSGKGKPTPLTKVIENKDGIEISFSAQGFDVSVTLNKVDADNLKGSLMNMFEAKAVRIRESEDFFCRHMGNDLHWYTARRWCFSSGSGEKKWKPHWRDGGPIRKRKTNSFN
jgi:hypothetical protein